MSDDDPRTLHMLTVHAHFDDHLGGQWEPWTDDGRDVVGWRWVSPDHVGHLYVYLAITPEQGITMFYGPHGDPALDNEIKAVWP